MKHLRTFYILDLTSVSFKDFPFLKDIIGGSLKICRSSGWFCIRCHSFNNACLMFGTDGWYCVTKGKILFEFVYLV